MFKKAEKTKPVHEMDAKERFAERESRIADIAARLSSSGVRADRCGDTLLMSYHDLAITIEINESDPRMIHFQTAFEEGTRDLIRAVLAASKATSSSYGAKAFVQGMDDDYVVRISYESIYPTVDDLFKIISFPLALIADCRDNYIAERTTTA